MSFCASAITAPPSTQVSPPPPRPERINPDPSRKLRISTIKQAKGPIDPTVKWTSCISRCCRAGRMIEAALEFTRMRLDGVEPNSVTFITLLSGCADLPSGSWSFGISLHACVHKLGLDRDDVTVGTALVRFYAKCGRVDLARLVFEGMRLRNAVSWNTMIDGCIRKGEVEDAVELFDTMPHKDAVSWTTLISGFVKMGEFEYALGLFREMQLSGIEPDYVTIIGVITACANLGTPGLGLWVNRFIMKQDFKDNVKVHNSLIDMYSRCGCIEFARQVFENMPERTLVSWNSIIGGFAVNGKAEEALKYFQLMQDHGFLPNAVSFTGALTACSHARLVDEGLHYFDTMKRVHGIEPGIEHFGCIVDLYGRAGRLEDAMKVVESMPVKPNEVVLGSLLAACRTHGNIKLAQRLMKYLIELDPGGDSNYVLLSNLYAGLGRWDAAGMTRREMRALGIRKKPGLSCIEVGRSLHEFVAGDKTHVDSENIYAMLNLLSVDLQMYGYVPNVIT